MQLSLKLFAKIIYTCFILLYDILKYTLMYSCNAELSAAIAPVITPF